MATVAFIGAGLLIPGAGAWMAGTLGIWGIAGATMLTSFIDQKFVYPALFPYKQPKVDRDNFSEIGFSSAMEGSPLPYSMGLRCKVQGIYAYASEDRTTPSAAAMTGKGGGSR